MTVLLMALLALILVAIGTPLFVVMGVGALAGFSLTHQEPAILIGEITRLAEAPGLSALPLFTLAGVVMANSRSAERLVALARPLFGWMPGGLAIVSLTVCAVFTAITGASGVTIIALGGLLLPALLHEGYHERFSLGLLTSSGSLGLLFPPSLPLILYGLVAGISIADLFRAGIFPGLLLMAFLVFYSASVGLRSNVVRHRFDLSRIGQAAWNARYELPIPALILGGIYAGLTTASEAAAVTAVYVVAVEVFAYRDLSLSDLPKVGVEAMSLIGAIILILGMAMGFTNFLVDQRVMFHFLGWIEQWVGSRVVFLAMLNVFLLVVGSLMDIFSAIVVIVPLIQPIALHFGVDPVHLGIIFLANLEIGYSTPPVGMNLFLASFRFEKPVAVLYRSVLPWVCVMLVVLMLITYLPWLSLVLIDR